MLVKSIVAMTHIWRGVYSAKFDGAAVARIKFINRQTKNPALQASYSTLARRCSHSILSINSREKTISRLGTARMAGLISADAGPHLARHGALFQAVQENGRANTVASHFVGWMHHNTIQLPR